MHVTAEGLRYRIGDGDEGGGEGGGGDSSGGEGGCGEVGGDGGGGNGDGDGRGDGSGGNCWRRWRRWRWSRRRRRRQWRRERRNPRISCVCDAHHIVSKCKWAGQGKGSSIAHAPVGGPLTLTRPPDEGRTQRPNGRRRGSEAMPRPPGLYGTRGDAYHICRDWRWESCIGWRTASCRLELDESRRSLEQQSQLESRWVGC